MKYRGKKRRLLEWLKEKPKLEVQVRGSGLLEAAEDLRIAGLVERCDDESVRERDGLPAAALRLTDAGRAAFQLPAEKPQ